MFVGLLDADVEAPAEVSEDIIVPEQAQPLGGQGVQLFTAATGATNVLHSDDVTFVRKLSNVVGHVIVAGNNAAADLESQLEGQMVTDEPILPLFPKSDRPPAPEESADVTEGDDVVQPTQSHADVDEEPAATQGPTCSDVELRIDAIASCIQCLYACFSSCSRRRSRGDSRSGC